jgi:hypothetical protein
MSALYVNRIPSTSAPVEAATKASESWTIAAIARWRRVYPQTSPSCINLGVLD